MKAQVRDGLLNGMQENTGTIQRAWSVFADALEAEAGEHRISYTVFSLPKFISFLINGHAHDPNSLTHQVVSFHDVQNPTCNALQHSNSTTHSAAQFSGPYESASGAVSSGHEDIQASAAPGRSSSSGSLLFIRAAQDNAHNPILHANEDP